MYMSISTRLRQLLPLFFAVGLPVVFSTACDPVGSSSPGTAPDSLRISLLDAEEVVTGFSGSKSLRARPVQSLLEESGGRTKAEPSRSLDSQYACTISLYRPDGPQGAGYYFRSATFSFPDSVLARASGKAVTVRGHISASEVPHPSAINALLRCRLPAAEEATLPVRRFFRFGPKQLASTGDGATAAQTSRSDGTMSRLGQPSETRGGEAVTSSASCSGEAVVTLDGTLISSETYDNCPSSTDDGGIGLWGGGGGLSTEDGYHLRTLDASEVSGGGSSDPDPEPDNPCESDNPPDYCDEAGSCYDKSIDNENDRKIIRGLEDQGVLKDLWEKSNADASDQSKREERGGWIVSTDDGGYKLVEFDEVQSGVEYTPLGIRNISPGARPSGTVATLHTQPFEPGEIITDTEVIQQYLDENNLNDQYDAESVTANYPSEPSEKDFETAASINMKGYAIDGSNVYSYDDVNGVDTAVGRCGYQPNRY